MYRDILIILLFFLLRLPLPDILGIPFISSISYRIIADMSFLIIFFLILMGKKMPFSNTLFGWKKPKASDFLLGIIVSLLLFSLSLMITHIVPQKQIYDSAMIMNEILIYFLIIIASIVEELFYRGYAIHLIKRYTNASAPIIIISSSFFFAMGHIYQGMGGIVFSFFAGGLLSYILLRYKSITIPLLAHIVYNLFFYTMYMFDSGI